MTDFCIQIHPHRATDLDISGLRAACDVLAKDKTLISKFRVVDGTDGHYYLDLMFETDRPKDLWRVLEQELFQSSEFGEGMQKASMVMCEGQDGWNDYLLLHHFDLTVECDELA